MRIAIVGGGAAGCFAAVNIKEMVPEADVTVYEAGKTPLRKVSLTGGGRCNLTNSFRDVCSFESVYPRGGRLVKRLFNRFSNEDTVKWFNDRGVRLITQDDQRIFPVSQDAMEIVNVLESLMKRHGVKVRTSSGISGITPLPDGYSLELRGPSGISEETADNVVITTGGCSGIALKMLDGLQAEIVPPVPSLFSFNIKEVGSLTGTSVGNVSAGLAGTGFRSEGPLLITDWGMSGPAILKLSSYAARYLADNGYAATLTLNWTGGSTADSALSMLSEMASSSPQKQLSSAYPAQLNSRLWSFLLGRSGADGHRRWAETGSRTLRRIAATLTCDSYPVTGKNRFKGEFVTCGGVALSGIDPNTLESRAHPGLYFAGEILDIDAITGGFNLQAAWTTAFTAALAIRANKRM